MSSTLTIDVPKTMTAASLKKQMQSLGNADIAAHSQRFFKTGKGEYGEGDRFLGIRVPVTRKVARAYKTLPLSETLKTLQSPFHEIRLCALCIMVLQYSKADAATQQKIHKAYLDHRSFVNNWDLVDSSAHQLVGAHLENRSRKLIYRLARSKSLWDRRIAVIATYHFIKRDDFTDTLTIAEILLNDSEDLIHKAVGWMLRELGKRNPKTEKQFLDQFAARMPRTMLRYAIERWPAKDKKRWMSQLLPNH